jgi:Fe-S-cluster containining protein
MGENRKFFKKASTKKITLEEMLNRIYNTVDLRTTCNHGLSCCKVGCPQMHYSEFSSLINQIWKTTSKSDKIELICKSVEYFFHNEFDKFGMETLLKPCMLLDENTKGCRYYNQRCLNCRIYGLWPKDIYNERVDKFEKAYEGLLKREQLPLNKQCPNVKRVNNSQPLTEQIIDGMFKQLDELDAKTGNFSEVQIENRENYRTFHDWVLYKIFGVEWLEDLTRFMLSSSKEVINDQIEALKTVIRQKFAKDMPNLLS